MDTADPVLQQLRKLREGVGLTAGRLEASGAVMSALGTSDPQEGLERLQAALAALGLTDRAAALEVDYGVNLETHLQREPLARELTLLGTRRQGFATMIGRDVKTLARWSDRAVAELRASLLNDTFTGHLVVMAAVRAERIAGCTVMQRLDGTAAEESRSLHIDNKSQEPSAPCLIYGYPRDWRPESLLLGVSFMATPYPREVYAVVATDFFSVVFGEERYPLPIQDGTALCRIVAPRRDRLYAIFWRW